MIQIPISILIHGARWMVTLRRSYVPMRFRFAFELAPVLWRSHRSFLPESAYAA